MDSVDFIKRRKTSFITHPLYKNKIWLDLILFQDCSFLEENVENRT